MKKPLHIKLLELMAKEGHGVNFDVVPFINENFSYSYYIANKEKHSNRIDSFLEDLISRGFIENDDGKDYGAWIFETEGDNNRIITSFSQGFLYYKIKSQGLDYLDQYKLLRSTKWANIKAWIAIGIAAMAAGFTGWPLVTHNHADMKETKSQSAKLKQALQKKPVTNLKIPNKDTPRKYPSH